jgi:hypothetical protein
MSHLMTTSSSSGNPPKSEIHNRRPRGILGVLCSESLVFFCVWFFLLFAGRSAMLRDPGSFWHVVAGEKMLSTWQVPREDPYSFTFAGRPWVDNQWLAECGMAAVHRLAGWDGLLLLSATLLAAVYAWIAARLLCAGLHLLPTGLLLAVVLLIGSPQFHVRPLIVTIGLLGLAFAWLVDVEAGAYFTRPEMRRSSPPKNVSLLAVQRMKRPRQLWWLVPLFVLWTNLHGGVMAGIGTVGLCAAGWCVVSAMDVPPRRFRLATELALLVMALLAATLVNPYGIGLPQEWLQTLTMPLPSLISEHTPLDLDDPIGMATIALATGYLIVLLGVLPNRPRVVWLLPLVWFVLALQRVRNAPLFSITAAIALADMLPHSRVGRWLERREMLAEAISRPSGWHSAVLPLVVVVSAMAIQVAGIRVPVIGCGWARFDPTHWPIELLPKLDEVNRSVKDGTPIFNDLNLGGFLIYHTPRLRVFIDDRCTVYGGDFLQAYDSARCENPAQIDRWQQQYGFEYALVTTSGEFDRYLAETGQWIRVARTPPATLYQRCMGVSLPMK